nr:DUF4326 domain-containing protein [uncultured Vibrio sp.]
MNRILVLYPELFNCYSKFARKLHKILANLDSPQLVVTNDKHGLGQRFAEEHKISLVSCDTPLIKDIESFTHAVVFSDGEEFYDEVKALRQSSVITKVQKVSITRVVNITRDPVFNGKINTDKYEYIGRGSPWGNPYPIGVDGDDRDEVLRKYRYDFDRDNFLNVTKEDMLQLMGKRLGCFCKPDDCHGDIIAEFLNSYDDGK